MHALVDPLILKFPPACHSRPVRHARSIFSEQAPTLSQLLCQEPQRPVTSDQTTFVVLPFFFKNFDAFPGPGIGILVVFKEDVDRPISDLSSKIHATTPPIPQIFLRACNGAVSSCIAT